MTGCFSFRFQGNKNDTRASLAIFFSADISADIVGKVAKIDVEKNLVPEAIYVIGPKSQLSELKGLLRHASLLSEIDSFVGEPLKKINLLAFDSNGDFIRVNKSALLIDQLQDVIIQSGMLEIFTKRKGLIVASANYHFLKPSGDHCENFIRASNLLIAGHEVSFLSLALLPYLTLGLKKIYVDTSSISYLVSTALALSGKFKDNIPIIESFESYAFFSQQFDFVEDKDSLVLISATTSGTLGARLKGETSFEGRQILTLFHSKLHVGQLGIFDISSVIPQGTKSFKDGNCDLCKENSRLIRIVGDQFLPETPTTEQLLIRKADFSAERELFFKEFATKGILNWRVYPTAQSGSPEHFFIDLNKVLASPSAEFSNILISKINKYFSRDVQTVISLDDPGSAILCDQVKKRVDDPNSKVSWITLDSLNEAELKDGASVMVVAGAVTSGRKLLDASRKLRVLNPKSAIIYFVGFSKLPTEVDLGQLKRDLEMGGHELIVLRKCPMPRITSRSRTSWDVELDELRKWAVDNPFAEGELTPMLAARLQSLESTSPSCVELFLPTDSGSSLKLRQTFAFWSSIGLSTTAASQSDVYWTIQTIIHDLRMRIEGGLGSVYHTTVISPACFDRYNDGIIQAALLRAASPLELNYSIDERFSEKMMDVIMSVVENFGNDQGEAAFEFLLALWLGRMKLLSIHLTEIVDRCRNKASLNVDFNFLVSRLAAKVKV